MQDGLGRRMQSVSPHNIGEANAAAPCPATHVDVDQLPCQQPAELVLHSLCRGW